MKIALVGYGKMGKTIEQIALSRGHEIVSIIDVNNPQDFESEAFKSADVAIEFTTPATAYGNYMKCFAAGVPVVSGTTGWLEHLEEIKRMCKEEGKTSYDVRMTEVHHVHKLDAPSGTAITLAEGILENIDRKERWTLETAEKITDLPIHAIREGEVPGIHEVIYESDADIISIKHDAKSRAGFALGAVIAAEFTAGKNGFLGMNDLFHF